MISKCVGCTLEGAMTAPSKELVYGFPIDGPMNVLHVDDFTVGASITYAGDKGFLIAAFGMCTFAVAYPVPELNWTTYAQALSMIMLRFRLDTLTIYILKESSESLPIINSLGSVVN